MRAGVPGRTVAAGGEARLTCVNQEASRGAMVTDDVGPASPLGGTVVAAPPATPAPELPAASLARAPGAAASAGSGATAEAAAMADSGARREVCVMPT